VKQIPPGGEGKITASFNTDGYSGKPLFQTIDIYTNDPARPKLEVSFQGTVERFANINPQKVRLSGKSNNPIASEVSIAPLPKYPFKIVKHEVKEGIYISYQFEEKTENGTTTYLIKIENTKKDPGLYKDVILLKTDSSIRPEIQIPITGNIVK
jgi:hypothetical protein